MNGRIRMESIVYHNDNQFEKDIIKIQLYVMQETVII